MLSIQFAYPTLILVNCLKTGLTRPLQLATWLQTMTYLSRCGQSPLESGPPDCPRQNNRSPRTKYRSHTWSPLAADGPPCCRLRPFRNCLLAYGEQPGHCLLNQKQGEATSAEVSAGRGDDTTPIEEESA